MNFYIETLGCARNQVDSELLTAHVLEAGLNRVFEPDKADLIIVNTCSFIQDAIDASIDTILEFVLLRKEGRCSFLIVLGCLPERFKDDFLKSLPEVDFFAGTGAYFSILPIIEKLKAGEKPSFKKDFPSPDTAPLQTYNMPRLISDDYTAYVKIAEGCSRHCTYCIIPYLRGKQRSRPLDDILAETRLLIDKGVKELVFVAQETTDWGRDLNRGEVFYDLMKAICESTPADVWLRFLYAHPESFDFRLLDLMESYKNFCPYLDLPIQHASDSVLARMGRGYTRADMLELFNKIRERKKDIALRTTIITGFPGESEEDFEELLEFVKKVRFDHLGVFTYSDMEDLPSHNLKDHISFELATLRRDLIMETQALISWEKNQKRLSDFYPVLVETLVEGELAEGRTPFQAPEVDGLTYLDGDNLKAGDIVKVEITDAFDYDLAGNVVGLWEN